jgi:2-isopropylmalate synthase
MSKQRMLVYDTTLRDGSQAEGVSFSKADKIRVAERLDELGVAYIEGGWPGSNPKDIAFFEAVKRRKFKHAKVSAFGSTRRAKVRVEDEENIRLLLEAETPVVAIFGKSWMLHVKDVLKVSPAQNLEMVGDSCSYLRDHGREVVFDAEHFFDGYKDSPDYALDVIRKAASSGASTVTLCDTNGGTLPNEMADICVTVRKALPEDVVLGIHCHNDSELAVANSLVAASCGFRHVQGTINGFGERCGNANLCSIIPSLELKMGFECLPKGSLQGLRETSLFIDEIANIRHNGRLPYVGNSAFAHKGGMHVNAVEKNPATFEHIDPSLVGNKRRILVSDLSGRSNLVMKAGEQHLDLNDQEAVKKVLSEIKLRESQGYEYEAADGSFALLAKKLGSGQAPFFELDGFRVIVEKRGHKQACVTEATVKLNVRGEHELTASEGDGPVNALDKALRKALVRFYPEIKDVHLNDFKVRILDGDDGTAAKTRVLIESGNGKDVWGTVGVSENIIQASWEALVDSVEYALYKGTEKS